MGVKFGVLQQEKNRLRVCKSRVVRRIFDVRGRGIEGCRIFCSELHVCYCSPDIINQIVARKIIHNVACSMLMVNKKGIQSLLTKTEQEEPLGRLRSIM